MSQSRFHSINIPFKRSMLTELVNLAFNEAVVSTASASSLSEIQLGAKNMEIH